MNGKAVRGQRLQWHISSTTHIDSGSSIFNVVSEVFQHKGGGCLKRMSPTERAMLAPCGTMFSESWTCHLPVQCGPLLDTDAGEVLQSTGIAMIQNNACTQS